MLISVICLCCLILFFQCLVFNRVAPTGKIDSIRSAIDELTENFAGAANNSAECYNVMKRINSDIAKSAADFNAMTTSTVDSVKFAVSDIKSDIRKTVKSVYAGVEEDLKPSKDSVRNKISEMGSAVDALISSVVITRNSDGVVPTELLRSLVKATEDEDQIAFADSIEKAKKFFELYDPVSKKIVRETAIKKVNKRPNYGFF